MMNFTGSYNYLSRCFYCSPQLLIQWTFMWVLCLQGIMNRILLFKCLMIGVDDCFSSCKARKFGFPSPRKIKRIFLTMNFFNEIFERNKRMSLSRFFSNRSDSFSSDIKLKWVIRICNFSKPNKENFRKLSFHSLWRKLTIVNDDVSSFRSWFSIKYPREKRQSVFELATMNFFLGWKNSTNDRFIPTTNQRSRHA